MGLSEKLPVPGSDEKPWMKAFGALRHPHDETIRIDRVVEVEFGRIEPEDRAFGAPPRPGENRG